MKKILALVIGVFNLFLIASNAQALVLGPGFEDYAFFSAWGGDVSISYSVITTPEAQQLIDEGYYDYGIVYSWGHPNSGLQIATETWGFDESGVWGSTVDWWGITPPAEGSLFFPAGSDNGWTDVHLYSAEVNLMPPSGGGYTSYPTWAYINEEPPRAVPEPATMFLLSSGLVGVFLKHRRRLLS